jgi:hypothetical protein
LDDRQINYGNVKDGYWNSNHMLVGVEAVLDIWNTCICTSYIQPACEFNVWPFFRPQQQVGGWTYHQSIASGNELGKRKNDERL